MPAGPVRDGDPSDDGPVYETAVGGSVRIYFSRRWSVEPEFLYAQNKAIFSTDRNYILWGKVAFDFLQRDRRVVPYWYGGPGVTRHTTGINNPWFNEFTSSEAAFGTGLGVRFRLSDHIFVAANSVGRRRRNLHRDHRQRRVYLGEVS